MTTKTKTRLALSALVAALALAAAPAAFADPRDGWRGPPPSAQSSVRGDDYGRHNDWRSARPDYRNPNAFVNISFRERFERLESAIRIGFDRGGLTRREAGWLYRQLEDTRAMAISYRRSQDAYTVHEADEINARLDRIRFRIRDQRADGQWSSWRNDDWRGRGPTGY
jgi:hypothetical protein